MPRHWQFYMKNLTILPSTTKRSLASHGHRAAAITRISQLASCSQLLWCKGKSSRLCWCRRWVMRREERSTILSVERRHFTTKPAQVAAHTFLSALQMMLWFMQSILSIISNCLRLQRVYFWFLHPAGLGVIQKLRYRRDGTRLLGG